MPVPGLDKVICTILWYIVTMRISKTKLDMLCRKNRSSLRQTLRGAGVSPNAFYSLLRKPEILPRSIALLAEHLGVAPTRFLEDEGTLAQRAIARSQEARRLCRRRSEADREDVLHTLILLEEPPIDRLRRAITRANRTDIR